MAANAPAPNANADDDNEIRQTLADVQSYPVLTREISSAGGSRAGGAGTSAYGQIVQATLQEVLGWRPRPGDAKGFTAALNQSFTVREVQGHIEWKWTPRTYAIEVDLGAVTGAQASIYARARFALDHCLPLLEGLTPLRSDPDAQDIEAIRAIVRSGLTELVCELGLEGGPRLFRVDELFNLLLGEDPQLRDPENVGGQLGLLRDRYGLQRQAVNTIDEEQNLTNFLILVDETNALRQTWVNQRHFFNRRGPDVFFGTQMVQLSRALTVLAESIQETYDSMDSVFLGEAERQVTELRLNKQTIMLGELLSRVEGFATDEGPRLIQEGGKDGLIHAFRPTAIGLRNLAQAAAALSRQGSQNPTRGFHTPRVQRSLDETATHLEQVVRLSSQVQRQPGPFPTRISPASAEPLAAVQVLIEGARFQQGARVRLTLSELPEDQSSSGPVAHHIEGHDVDVISESLIAATFNLTSAPRDSLWSLLITNRDGLTGTLEDVFTIIRPVPPVIDSFKPTTGTLGHDVNDFTICGQEFHKKVKVHLQHSDGSKIKVKIDHVAHPGDEIKGHFKIPADATPGEYTLTVLNVDDQQAATTAQGKPFRVQDERNTGGSAIQRQRTPSTK